MKMSCIRSIAGHRWVTVAMGGGSFRFYGQRHGHRPSDHPGPCDHHLRRRWYPWYSGDNGPAASAELNNPYGMSVDSSGNLYIADATNNRIRKVAVGTGVISMFAGNGAAGYSGDGGAATGATLNSPEGVTFDTLNGVFYIADTHNNVIRSVSTAGSDHHRCRKQCTGLQRRQWGGYQRNSRLSEPAWRAIAWAISTLPISATTGFAK